MLPDTLEGWIYVGVVFVALCVWLWILNLAADHLTAAVESFTRHLGG